MDIVYHKVYCEAWPLSCLLGGWNMILFMKYMSNFPRMNTRLEFADAFGLTDSDAWRLTAMLGDRQQCKVTDSNVRRHTAMLEDRQQC
jgi:hypothetical protein